MDSNAETPAEKTYKMKVSETANVGFLKLELAHISGKDE
jgi:hypothetical protein